MAAYNIQLRRSNGSSFDIVYPKTKWSLVEDKPSTYTPSSHQHPFSQITGEFNRSFTIRNTATNGGARFNLPGWSSTTRTYTFPNKSGTLALTSDIPQSSGGLDILQRLKKEAPSGGNMGGGLDLSKQARLVIINVFRPGGSSQTHSMVMYPDYVTSGGIDFRTISLGVVIDITMISDSGMNMVNWSATGSSQYGAVEVIALG